MSKLGFYRETLLIPSINAQRFQRAIFVHKENRTEREFNKGDKLKVVCESTRGVSFDYRGRLVEVARDSIFLDMAVGEVGLPLASVVKIQKTGIAAWGIIVLIGGLIFLVAGLCLRLLEESAGAILGPVGYEQEKSGGIGLIAIGASLFLSGLLFSGHPSVKHPDKDWKLRTEHIGKPGQIP